MGATMRAWGLVLVVLVAVAGCAGGGPAAGDAGSAPAAPPDPLALVGWWQVAGSSATVAVDPSSVQVSDGCGRIDAAWRADAGGRFLARVTGVSLPAGTDPPASCAGQSNGPGTPPWLTTAAAFAVDGADRVLRDRSGAEVVRWQPAQPGTVDGVDPGRAPAPEERAAAAPAAAVPANLRPAGPEAVAGSWSPAGGGGRAFVDFSEAGTWTGSDGCNGTDGPWAAAPDGGFLAVAPTTSTLIACDGSVPVGTWLGSARRAALDGEDLVLLDVTGAPLGRFTRSS